MDGRNGQATGCWLPSLSHLLLEGSSQNPSPHHPTAHISPSLLFPFSLHSLSHHLPREGSLPLLFTPSLLPSLGGRSFSSHLPLPTYQPPSASDFPTSTCTAHCPTPTPFTLYCPCFACIYFACLMRDGPHLMTVRQ